MPEKAQRQHSFCLFGGNAADAIVWTVPDSAPDTASGTLKPPPPSQATKGDNDDDNDEVDDATPSQTYRTLLLQALNSLLPKAAQVLEPSEDEFASALVEAHRKAEKAYHVKAFRGSKDGKSCFPAIRPFFQPYEPSLPFLNTGSL